MKSKSGFKRTYHNFYERQKYRNIFVLLLLLAIECYLVYHIVDMVLTDKLWGAQKYLSWRLIAVTALVPTPMLLAFAVIRFETIITEEGIFYRWFPFRKTYHMLLWEGIREVFIIEMKNTSFMWRISNKYSETHFPGSKHGLIVHMKNGKTKLIGTRKASEMNRVLIRNSGNRYQSVFVEKYDVE